jgi:hypothetical protein
MRGGHSRGRCGDGYHHARRALLCAVSAIVTGLLLHGAPADALSQRGHVFSSAASFGSSGSGEGQLSSPAAVAVSEVGEAAGDVYVADRGNNRIEQFDSSGNFVAAWGWGVKDGEKEAEVCKAGEGCKPGTPGTGKGSEAFHLGKGQLVSPEAIAVDNSRSGSDPSAGDLYVVASVVPEKSYVDKFSANGEYIRQLTKKEETESNGRVEGVAVDPNGAVWVDWSEGEITSFTGGEPNKRVSKAEEVESSVENLRPGLAVDGAENLYVDAEPGELFTPGEEGSNAEEGKGENGEEPCEASPCFAAKLRGSGEPGATLIERVERQNTGGIAADAGNDDVYLDNVTSIAMYGPGGTLIQRFGAGDVTRGAGVAVQANDGNVYVADAAAGRVETFVPEPAAKPSIDEVSAAKILSSSAELSALINPTGAETTVTFEYGTSSCAEGTCVAVPLSASIGSSFEDRSATTAHEVVELSASTTYHYRVLATNSFGTTIGEERTFTTQSGAPLALLDGRGWEQVSPTRKNGAGFESITKEGGLIQAAEDGSAITYVATAPDEAEPEGNRSPEFTQILSSRGPNGEGRTAWTSKDITTPNDLATGVEAGQPPEYQYFTPNLSEALVRPKGPEPALSEEASEVTPYVRENAHCGPVPSTCYRPLVTGREGHANVPPGTRFGGAIGGGVQILDAEPDLEHVVLKAEVPLTGAPVAAEENLYEWSEGRLQLINVLPEAEGPAVGAKLGTDNNDVRHALADGGARVLWTASTNSPLEGSQRLYLRDMLKHETIRIDTVQEGVAEQVSEGAGFAAANAEGSRVFFTDVEPLTAGSRASRQTASPDLYACEVVEHAGRLACSLHDLTEDRQPGGERADVQGTMLGESEDGSSIYFVANGVLDSSENAQKETATPGECERDHRSSQATCNLYVERYDSLTGKWDDPRFVAALSNEDEPDWYSFGGSGGLTETTSRVSPNGRYLSFMSDRSLTGYDNRDVNSGALDEEVYLYDSATGELVCASCNPTGGRPGGVFDKAESGEEGLGLLVDRAEVWAERWLAGSIPGWTPTSDNRSHYQSRYLSDSGRLFFDSADGLVSADTNHREDVYEYEPGGLGSCSAEAGCVGLVSSGNSERESAFLDASASGDDVFFLTADPLAARDQDTNFDVYDARVCAPEGCISVSEQSTSTCQEAATCRPAAPTRPVFSAPATTAPSGSSNLSPPRPSSAAPKVLVRPTRAQLLAKALKTCRRYRTKHKRAACERLARKRYRAGKAGHKAGSSSRRRGRR